MIQIVPWARFPGRASTVTGFVGGTGLFATRADFPRGIDGVRVLTVQTAQASVSEGVFGSCFKMSQFTVKSFLPLALILMLQNCYVTWNSVKASLESQAGARIMNFCSHSSSVTSSSTLCLHKLVLIGRQQPRRVNGLSGVPPHRTSTEEKGFPGSEPIWDLRKHSSLPAS